MQCAAAAARDTGERDASVHTAAFCYVTVFHAFSGSGLLQQHIVTVFGAFQN
jgi:hypothetical protein